MLLTFSWINWVSMSMHRMLMEIQRCTMQLDLDIWRWSKPCLSKGGADKTVTNRDGMTALDLARRAEKDAVVAALA
jgi:hypothetical protein